MFLNNDSNVIWKDWFWIT